MPAYTRRPKPSGAVARLPPSRLPLGTPQLPSPSQASSRATDRSTSASSSHKTTSSGNNPGMHELNTADMSSPTQPITSTAEAKLQRQNERIELAEAALANPAQLDRSRPQSRAKSKFPPSLRPSDDSGNSERSRTTSVSSGGVAIETRINSYRSDGPRPARHHNKSSLDITPAMAPEAAQMERQDSVLDETGFQTYTGRRGSRRGELGAYEDRTEIKQIAVEASVDQREILNVFANALPGLDFLTCQTGRVDGQVQFIQHPSGDVSAHMWYNKSYQWNNIGAFSNIRKKVEGQLAGDNLRGESAYQKLQQNTLAYFRAIAKQREAAVTGVDFGRAELQQLLPEPSQAKQPETSKLNATTPAFSHRIQDSRLLTPRASQNDTAVHHPFSQQLVQPTELHSFYAIPQGSRIADNHFQVPPSPKNSRVAEDPFTANAYGPAFTRLGPEYNGGTVAGPARQSPSSRSAPSIETRQFPNGLYNSPTLPAVPNIGMTYKPLPALRTSPSEALGRTFGSQSYLRTSIAGVSSTLPSQVVGTEPNFDRRHSSAVSIESPRRKPVTPLQAREAMRENLFKISDHAVERSVSRENLHNLSMAVAERETQSSRRSMLHDPFQPDDRNMYRDYDSSSVSHRSDSKPYHAGMQSAPRADVHPKPDRPLRWDDSQLLENVSFPVENHLTDSVADVIDEGYPTPTSRIHSSSYDFNASPRASHLLQSASKLHSASPDRQSKDWRTSGAKFARQEEHFQDTRAIAEPTPSNDSNSGHTSTARRLIVAKPEVSAAGEALTRVLIPVYESLSSYVEGPVEKRRDYWSRWSQAPDWCIDHGPNGNKSFYEDAWPPPLRNGRDSRQSSNESGIRFAGVAVPASLERRLEFNRYH